MQRHRECEKFIIRSLQRGACRIEAFDGREFNKATVNASVNRLLHDEVIHSNGFFFHWGPPPVGIRKQKLRTPDLTQLRSVLGKGGKPSEHRIRAKKYHGELTDKSG